MALVRTIGRWSFTALIVNTVIGGGIFGLPAEVNRLVGRASPIAMLLAGLGMGVMMACFAEVASQFSEPGGAYLYTRTAFGPFLGVQVAWFSWLTPMAAGAAVANLITIYLAGFFPEVAGGLGRAGVLSAIIAFLVVANYVGVRSGTRLSNLFTIAKLLPLAILIILGVGRFTHYPEAIHWSDITAPGLRGWSDALLILVFAYGGFENVMLPMGEVRDPRRTVPFSLAVGLVVCMGIYTLIQFIVVITIGAGFVERPLAASASVLIGSSGALFVTIAAMISSYGNLSAMMLASPRLTYSLAQQHEFPSIFGWVHPRFQTPYVSIVIFGTLSWILAVSGTFRWAIAVAAGAVMITYAAVCASLIRLRQMWPNADALRLPVGPAIAMLGIVMASILITRLGTREMLLLALTASLATANFVWVKLRRPRGVASTDSSASAG